MTTTIRLCLQILRCFDFSMKTLPKIPNEFVSVNGIMGVVAAAAVEATFEALVDLLKNSHYQESRPSNCLRSTCPTDIYWNQHMHSIVE